MPSYFSRKRKRKKKVTKCFKCVKEFFRRFDFAIFKGVFARIVKVTYFPQVINFSETAHGKVHPRKVNRQIGKDGNRQINNNDKE